jgi:L-xylulokinase
MSFGKDKNAQDSPRPRWSTRNFVRPGQWMHMSLPPIPAGNLEWSVQRLCQTAYEAAESSGDDLFGFVEHEVSAVADPSYRHAPRLSP